MPFRGRLGPSEAARVLGQIFLKDGDTDGALEMLRPYAEARLPRLQAAQKALENAEKAAQDRLRQELTTGMAPGFNYAAFNAATDAEKNRMVREFAETRLKADPGVASAVEELGRQAKVVPVALDLGMILLEKARGTTDPAARRKALEESEAMFRGVQGVAGESDALRLSLGQVDYWLGKPAEGKTLFDEVLESKGRSFPSLMSVSTLLREVGSETEAKALAEEAFNKANKPEEKSAAAMARAILTRDLDEQIAWYRKGDPNRAEVKVHLTEALGRQALRDGRDDEAISRFRECVADYDRAPEGVGTLNNAALVCFELFRLTGQKADFELGRQKMDRAIALEPRTACWWATRRRSSSGRPWRKSSAIGST